MKRVQVRRPSPATIIAITALVVAIAGTAIAGPLAGKSALSKSERKQTKKIASSEIAKAAPTLSVGNASTVDGKNASELQTSSASAGNAAVIANLPVAFMTLVSATITTQSSGRVLATGSADLSGADGDERAQCKLVIDGTGSVEMETTFDDIGTSNEAVLALSHGVTRSAGTYTASLECRAETGTVGKDDAAINVYGLGS